MGQVVADRHRAGFADDICDHAAPDTIAGTVDFPLNPNQDLIS